MNEDKTIYVLDTSALLTYIEDEEGSEDVENILMDAEKEKVAIYLAFISITEIFYITTREKGASEALKRIELINSLAVQVKESDEEFNISAGKLKAQNKISLADSYIAALNLNYNGILVHKDPEFEKLLPSMKEYRLPYKGPEK